TKALPGHFRHRGHCPRHPRPVPGRDYRADVPRGFVRRTRRMPGWDPRGVGVGQPRADPGRGRVSARAWASVIRTARAEPGLEVGQTLRGFLPSRGRRATAGFDSGAAPVRGSLAIWFMALEEAR